ncbi:hypothetical protein OBBRIDRAFT_774042 [Obba rivulosa]|uniref:CSN8/PSMD8/EIF3K domain-containing protein n=1 Tax=Obba rivulosa TaxID=1052685 RepID=A0A8E2DNY6_9APHY|nr:hypothetical protein OBBRIDRAFT_774042 [Obba rivulosa]
MTGPPTPPPTTQAEIEDATRDVVITETAPSTSDNGIQPLASSVLPVAADQPSTVTRPGAAYRRLVPVLVQVAKKRDLEELIRVAERGDYTAGDDHHPDRLLITAPLVLAYLIKNDLPPARHALTRLPQGLAGLPLSQALFNLLASVWNRKYTAVYTRAEELYNMSRLPDFPDMDLGSILAEMTALFTEVFREKTFALLASAYDSLPLSVAQACLGLQPERVLETAARSGWSYDASAQILSPTRAKDASRVRYQSIAPSNLTSFQVIIDSVAQLD